MARRSGYFDFLHGAQEAFGLTWGEAKELYRETSEALGFPASELGREAIDEYFDVVDTLVQRFYERPDIETYERPTAEAVQVVSPYTLDPAWPNDEWLDAQEWYEISGEYEDR